MSTETTQKNSGAPTVFGVIGWIGTLLVFASVGIRFLKPEWAQYQQYAAWAGLALVLVYLAGQWRDISTFYEGRGARYGTLSIVSIVVFAGILVAVNYLASRQNKRWDLTSNQVYSLSDQTIKILQTLDAPVKFTVFDRETSLDMHRDRLDAYTYQSPKVTAEYIDPEKNPLRAKAAEITALGTVIVEYKDRTERVTTIDEQNLTNALIKAVTGETRKVYFTQGHGEKDTVELGSHRLQRHRRRRWARTTTASNGCCWRRRGKCPPTPRCWSWLDRRPTSCSPRSRPWPSTWPGAARCWR